LELINDCGIVRGHCSNTEAQAGAVEDGLVFSVAQCLEKVRDRRGAVVGVNEAEGIKGTTLRVWRVGARLALLWQVRREQLKTLCNVSLKQRKKKIFFFFEYAKRKNYSGFASLLGG